MNNAITLIRSIVPQSSNLLNFDDLISADPSLFKDRDRLALRTAAEIGQSVKVGASGEYFWVEVCDRTTQGVYVGRVDNDLRCTEMHGLKRGDIVVFGPEHIRLVEDDERFPKPLAFNKPLIMLMPLGAGEMKYNDPMGGDYMTLADFRESCEDGSLTDYDGHGYAVGFGGDVACTTETFVPSRVDCLPDGTSHVIWFNK